MDRGGGRWRNPVAFTPYPVTVICTFVYLILFTSLVVVHHYTPKAPASETPVNGINITEAWHDLQFLSNGFHPYNSKRIDVVRNWLLQRIDEILEATNASYDSVPPASSSKGSSHSSAITVFNDLNSNLTFSQTPSSSNKAVVSTYFEGINVIVYVRGNRDPAGHWWSTDDKPQHGGVLVNAHYDSVSTGYGATDDGVGIVSRLQLLRYFSTSDNKPEKGITLLLGGGEEEGLNGARAYARHPISKFPHTFLNLEGAGAGGRATLFRSTDTEVTSFYQGTEHPFGTAVSGDAFKRGLIKSDTDYTVFHGVLGLRGLDVAFYEPRSQYHTSEDDARHTSIDSLWHMLSAAIHTTSGLAANTDETFEGAARGHGMIPSGSGTVGVWFDLFGRSFAVFELHTLFAVSVTLLVVCPIVMIATATVLSKTDRLYLFSTSARLHHDEGYEKIPLHGLRGFFRFPLAFVVASAIVFGLALLTTKVNPYIAYSSQYAVWSMMLSAWLFVLWFFGRAANFMRPTALHRTHALLWVFLLGWIALVIATVYEDKLALASGYFIVFGFALTFLAAWISLLELFALPTRSGFAESLNATNDADSRGRRGNSITRSTTSGPRLPSQERSTQRDEIENEDEESTESTALLAPSKRSTFANYLTNRTNTGATDDSEDDAANGPRAQDVYEYEQLWSASLPKWPWLLQFLLLAVIPIILVGQIGLLMVSAGHQTSADGNPPVTPYFIMALMTIFLLAPLSPFIHRFTYHVPLFLLAVLVGTLIYNLAAFPFSDNNRLKLYFIQRVDLDTGLNVVGINGMASEYIDKVVNALPSAAGKTITKSTSRRVDLVEHSWHGLEPNVLPGMDPHLPPSAGYADWLHFNTTRLENANEAVISLVGNNTRSCRLTFDTPIADFRVEGSDTDPRFPGIPEEGVKQIRLWSRDWERGWNVTVKWGGDRGLDGRAVCLWNDEAGRVRVPALEEFRRFAPDWATVTKLDDGLVEGSKAFMI